MKALIQNGAVAQFPYSLAQMKQDNPNVGFPRNVSLPFEGPNGTLVEVVQADMPTLAAGQKAVPDTSPSLANGEWVLGWTVQAMTSEEAQAEHEKMRAEVNSERARRLVAGTSVTITGHGPVALSGRDEDTRNLQGLAFAAQLRLADGNTAHQTTFRDAENVDHVLTPAQVLEMWSLGSAWIEQVYAASWALKDSPNGIPADYANDGYWPQ
ncbi:hypothetical protein [Tritonibacter mobilis]|uniref:DUF4376 domain-containing protein n=1 Tax=Tritonibacter mobilis TaxID=379347 RepID=UPI003A5C5B80